MSQSAAATPAEFRKTLWLGVLGINVLAFLLVAILFTQSPQTGAALATADPLNNLLPLILIGLVAFMLASFFLARRLLQAWTTQAATLARL